VPQAYAIVDPNQEGCTYPCKALAGVGVAFKIIRYLYELSARELPAKVYELLLLGTVADVVPLTGENRYWVRHGLAHVNRYESYAMRVLKQNNKFVIPIINKSDDMTMNDNKLICNSKFKDNYLNILKILEEYQLKFNYSKFMNPILYSAQESYIYRSLLKNPDYKLTEEMKENIGINDMGKKYYNLSSEERTIRVKEIVRNNEFIETMIKMSGYSNLHESLVQVLNTENQKLICSSKLFNKLENLKINYNPDIYNIISIYDDFKLINEESKKLKNIFESETNFIDEKTDFVKLDSNERDGYFLYTTKYNHQLYLKKSIYQIDFLKI
jgi:hypothetical protein